MKMFFLFFFSCFNSPVANQNKKTSNSSSEENSSVVLNWTLPSYEDPMNHGNSSLTVITSVEDVMNGAGSVEDTVIFATIPDHETNSSSIPDNWINPPPDTSCTPFNYTVLRKNNGFNVGVYTGFIIDEVYLWNIHRYPPSVHFSMVKNFNQDKILNYLAYAVNVFNNKNIAQSQIDSSVMNLLPEGEPFVKIVLVSGNILSEVVGPLQYNSAPINDYLLYGTEWNLKVRTYEKNLTANQMSHQAQLPQICHEENIRLKKIFVDLAKSSLENSQHKLQICLRADECPNSDLRVYKKNFGSNQGATPIPTGTDLNQFCSQGYSGHYYEIFTPTDTVGDYLEFSCESKDTPAYKKILRIDRGTKRGRG